MLQRRHRLGYQHLHRGSLKLGGQIGPIGIDEIRRRRGRQHRRLQAAETEIEILAVQHRSRQLEAPRHALQRQPRQHRPTGIGQAEQLGGLVESLASRVIHRLTKQSVVANASHAHQLGMPAGHQQRHERETRRRGREQRRQQVTFQVMHRQRRHAQRHPERLGHTRPHQQRPGQPWSGRVGNGVDVAHLEAARLQGFAQKQRQAADVVPGRQLRHHAAVGRMQIDLRVQTMGKKAQGRVVDGYAGLVARGFDTQNAHGQPKQKKGFYLSATNKAKKGLGAQQRVGYTRRFSVQRIFEEARNAGYSRQRKRAV